MFCETGKGMVQAYTLVKVSNTCNQYDAHCSTPTAELEPRQSEVVPGATVRLFPPGLLPALRSSLIGVTYPEMHLASISAATRAGLRLGNENYL